MKKIYKSFILLTFVTTIISCQKEMDFESKNVLQTQLSIENIVKNGRFVFSSSETLAKTIEDLQNRDAESVEQEFEKFYDDGFRSYSPIVNPKNELLQTKLSEEIILKREQLRSSKSFKRSNVEEDEEELISDPFLALLVNQNNEIIVKDTLYKFTIDKGLYFAHVQDSTYLFEYLKLENEESGHSRSQFSNVCDERTNYGGVTQVDNRISRFIAPIDEDCNGGGGGSGGSSYPPSIPQLSENERLRLLISNLPICDPSTPFFQNIFGKTYVCTDTWASGQRIKTEFWSQNYLFYESVGLQTKIQTKTLGIWWESDAEEIYLGINRILLKYNFPQPQINSYSHPQLFQANSYQNPIYMWDGKFKVKVNNAGFGAYVDTQLNLTNGNLPFFNFEDDQILNIYIPKLFDESKFNLNLTSEDILSESNIKALYKLGIDYINESEFFNSGNIEKRFAITYQKDYNKIEVVYFGEQYRKTNTNYLKRTLYNSGANFVVSYALSEGPRQITTTQTDIFGNVTTIPLGIDYTFAGKFTVEPVTDFFRDYTHFDLDFYAMARRGSNNWKGHRMLKN